MLTPEEHAEQQKLQAQKEKLAAKKAQGTAFPIPPPKVEKVPDQVAEEPKAAPMPPPAERPKDPDPVPPPSAPAAAPAPAAVLPQVLNAEALGMREMDIVLFNRAKFYSQATIIPKDYQGNPANCYIAVQVAHRMDLDPMFVMNALYIVHGRPAWSSKALIQLAKSTVLKDLTYVVDKSDPNNWKCTAHAQTRDGRFVEGPEISVSMARSWGWWDKNPIWRNGTELMLRYRAAAWLISTEFPECTAGFLTKEEVDDTEALHEKPAKKNLDSLLSSAKPETAATSPNIPRF